MSNITTVEKVKKAGWAEVEHLQRQLRIHKVNLAAMGQMELLSGEGARCREAIDTVAGKIQGMVHVLNMLK